MRKITLDEVLKYVSENSDCKLISTEYINARTNLQFKCSCGNIFERTFGEFKIRNKKCKKCSLVEKSSRRLSVDEVKSYIESHGCELISEYKTNNSKINIKCSCGEIFKTTWVHFKFQSKTTCDECVEYHFTRVSKPSIRIAKWLEKNNWEFKTEYTFKNHKSPKGGYYRYDFAVFKDGELKTLIEYDGEFHYKGPSDAVKRTQTGDKAKNKYCKENNINLIRIPYFKQSEIETILFENFI